MSEWNAPAHLSVCPKTIDNFKDFTERVYLPTDITTTLSSLDFVKDGFNVCVLEPSDSGKSYLAKALGIEACMKFRTAYYHCEEILETMEALKQANYLKYQKKIRFHMKQDLMILDDFFCTP